MKFLILVICFLATNAVVDGYSISRDIVANDSLIKVTLVVDVDGESYYAIDESYPKELTAIHSAGFHFEEDNHAKIASINAIDANLTYYLNAPIVENETSYRFSGLYMIESMVSPSVVSGMDIITIYPTKEEYQENMPENTEYPTVTYVALVLISCGFCLDIVNVLQRHIKHKK
jgi:hypothetical protein